MPYFTFDQNNSGGDLVRNENVDEHVIIQAPNALTANAYAEEVGIYFNGCESGQDCPCCGDRWYEMDESYGTKVPTIYGRTPDKYKDRCIIHFEGGVIIRLGRNA